MMLDWIISSFQKHKITKPKTLVPEKLTVLRRFFKNDKKYDIPEENNYQILLTPPKCQICEVTTLGRNSKVASPSCCRNIFCEECFTEWTKRSDASCPIDGKLYNHFLVYDSYQEAFTSNHTFATKYTVNIENESTSFESLEESSSNFEYTTSVSDLKTDAEHTKNESSKYETANEDVTEKSQSCCSLKTSNYFLKDTTGVETLEVDDVEFTVERYVTSFGKFTLSPIGLKNEIRHEKFSKCKKCKEQAEWAIDGVKCSGCDQWTHDNSYCKYLWSEKDDKSGKVFNWFNSNEKMGKEEEKQWLCDECCN